MQDQQVTSNDPHWGSARSVNFTVSDATSGSALTLNSTNVAGSIAFSGAASDVIYYNLTGTGTTVGSASATGNDLLLGGTGNDTIYVGTGTNHVLTGNGNDLVSDIGTSGTGTITGGTGNDTVDFTGANISLTTLGAGGITGFGHYVLDGSGTASVTTGGTLVAGSVTSSSGVTIDGSALTGAETIAAGAFALGTTVDVIGGGGNGADSIDLHSATDHFNATINGGSGSGADTLVGNSGIDSITANTGNDTITGHDTVTSAGDTLAAGSGVDVIANSAVANTTPEVDKFGNGSLVPSPSMSTMQAITLFSEANGDKFDIYGLTASPTINTTYAAASTDTLAVILANANHPTAVGQVELVTFGATSTGVTTTGGLGATAAVNHDEMLLVGVSGGVGVIFLLHGAGGNVVASSASLANDFITFS